MLFRSALAMALEYGLEEDKLKVALASFKGVKRRFTYQLKTEDLVYIDDYAHHPAEIKAVHQAVREIYRASKVVAVFQPHLSGRSQDFADDFAESLTGFDELILLDIYPARELPIPGVDSKWLLEKVTNTNKKLVQKSDLIQAIKKSDASLIITMGAGDIGEEVKFIKQALQIEK